MSDSAPSFSTAAYLLPHINREGRRFGLPALALAVAVAVASWWFGWLGWIVVPLFLLAYGVFMFFRDPDRFPPEDETAIVSPADGRICLVRETELPDSLAESDGGAKHWCVSVFMSVLDVHVNRMPTAGQILRKEYVAAGKFLNASLDKASKENERCNYLVKAGNGQTYGVTQIAGLVARRIVPQVEEGQLLSRAERFGLIRFGSRLDVYLPVGVRPEVRVGQTMVAGETVIGHLSRG